MTEKDLTGKVLERRVADAYRRMGATKVEHDVELAGNQIDVYVELPAPGQSLLCIAVEVKDYERPVGIRIVNDFAQIVDLLYRRRLVHQGVLVGASGFSKPARNAAKEYGIRLLEPDDLEAMAAEVHAPRPITPLTRWSPKQKRHRMHRCLPSPPMSGYRQPIQPPVPVLMWSPPSNSSAWARIGHRNQYGK